jgi:hypothetical protein
MSDAELTFVLEAKLMEYARRDSGALPMIAGDARVVEAFLSTLAAKAAGDKPGLRWREQMDGFALEWYCEPPRPSHRFRVNREVWTEENGQPVRRVYEIGDADGTTGSPGESDSDGRAGSGTGTPASPEATAPA